MRNKIHNLFLLIIVPCCPLYGQMVTWESLGGPITGGPAVCSWMTNRLDVFVCGTDNALWTKSWNGNQWSGFTQLGTEKIASDPAAVSWGPNRIDVFVRGTDNMLYTKSWDGNRWSGYLNLSGPITGGPAVCSWMTNRLDVFVRGTDNTLWTKSWNGNQWSGFTQLGTEKIASDPAAVSWGANRIDVFVRGTDNMLYTKSWDGNRWSGYTNLSGPINEAPTVSSQSSGRLDVFVHGTDNTLWTKSWNGSQWNGFTQLGTEKIASDPAAVSWGPNRIDVFVRCEGNNLCHKWWDGAWMPPVAIADGNLYREISKPEVYVIHDEKKIWIPTQDALYGMGYSWNQVNIVPDGALSRFTRFNIPSASATPGSLIYPPDLPKHHALKTSISTRVWSQGSDVQVAELRGWLVYIGEESCNEDEGDTGFLFELDVDWAISRGLDVQEILRVGNIVCQGDLKVPGANPRKMVSRPLINVETNSWGWANKYPANKKIPDDWNISIPNCAGRKWPFNPYKDVNSKPIPPGSYVSMSGSLVTDSPHEVMHRPGTFLSKWLGIWTTEQGEWEGSVPDWHPGVSSDASTHYARWTEMHPPDLINILPYKPLTTTIRGLALCARVAATPGPLIPSCEEIEFDVYPEAQRPANATLEFQELRGPECYFPWGENKDNGTWVYNRNDHIHVRAKVCGGALGGSPGRIKALYRVWWKEAPLPEIKFSSQAMRSTNVLKDKRGFFIIKAVNAQGQNLAGQVYYNNARVGSTNQQFSLPDASTGCIVENRHINCPSKFFSFTVVVSNQTHNISVTLPQYLKKI